MMSFFEAAPSPKELWDGRYKIPWDEAGFSSRMLDFHLCPDHDMASRRSEGVALLSSWIHTAFCQEKGRRILDLGCGPGLYMAELARLGHELRGIDFGPASVNYGKATLPAGCVIEEGDIRKAEFGEGWDLVLLLYGELNVFSPDECRDILARAWKALKPGGRLLFEAYTHEGARAIGEGPRDWYAAQGGLFSASPHVCLTENFWLDEVSTSVQRFHVHELGEGNWTVYRSTTKAWTDDEWRALGLEAGFWDTRPCEDPPDMGEPFRLWVSTRGR